ncbi:hypothetical protein [uncultured Eubacterium sp.]|jgi:hypothetical protein|uniref:Uncharacterized protein n=1 Tax=Myoviridae sp. ct8iP21 TaxID=2825041 RepID=A0A8S5V421_9CAUD|nr:hypothetical protein [uncultured Eubacterium sp.]DAG01489.1 MAG TPA: hypothetical protein [Myoviridae sp. ct8iP21]
MDDLLPILIDAFKREFGEDEKINDGDTVVFELNDCTVILSLEDASLKTEVIGDKPIRVNYTTGYFE